MASLPDVAIRIRRAAFNRALAEGDISAIGPLLAKDVVLVTGSDSAVVSGRSAQLITWRRAFAEPARSVYTRTPETVIASPVEPIALEHGSWHCVRANAEVFASGAYSAKWREVGKQWVIEAEIYVTLT